METKRKSDKKFKNFMKKFWNIVWKDNSVKGWIISIIFIVLVLELIFFPVLKLTLGTKIPLVIVESCSMYHQGGPFSQFDNWWEGHDMKYFIMKISKNVWQTFPLKNGFNKGDIIFVRGEKPNKIKVGDVIIFKTNYPSPIIHRVIKIKKVNGTYIFQTMGDNNNGQLDIEKTIYQNQILGVAKADIIPYLGWIKLIFFDHLNPVEERGLCSQTPSK